MAASLCALLVFTAWTLLLIFLVVNYRGLVAITGKTAINSWTRDAAKWEDPAVVTRMQHAHLNCLENLPLFAAVVLVAAVSNQLAVVDPLVWVFIAARMAQSVVHVIGTSVPLVFLRATGLIVQYGLLTYWMLGLGGII